jgi:hypothetical protein
MLVISAALDLDLNIAAERAHEAEQPLKGEAIEAPAQQIGNVGLTDSHPLGRSLTWTFPRSRGIRCSVEALSAALVDLTSRPSCARMYERSLLTVR